ncbi:MAG TPA: sulfotransferase [Oleiagrimonas sp.]|nr:sulfotransferase [Oleiagrimonas sp.]
MTIHTRQGDAMAGGKGALSPSASRLLDTARSQWQRRQFDAVAQTLAQVLALAPDNPDALRMLGMAAQRRRDNATAIDCFRRVLRVWPDDVDLHVGLGIALYEHGDAEEAIALLRRACELAPDSPMAWFNFGEAIGQQAGAEEAVAAFRRVLELAPTHTLARLSLARQQANLGRIDAAVTGFRHILKREPGNADAWFGLSNLNTVRFDVADVSSLQHALARDGRPPRERELLAFTLAKALEDQGQYARAFDLFVQGNASRRKRVRWNAVSERKRVDAIERMFSGMPVPPTDVTRGREVIFIVSIPRSGTTLVEQILASHPDVEGANEIEDLRQLVDAETRQRRSAFPLWAADAGTEDWQRMGEAYLARTMKWRQHRPRFTDKSMVNWYLVGAALHMLPAARVVIVRRDPVETCLGCFRQCFSEASGFACTLDEMADYCIDFRRLSRFWLDKYPERVFDLSYEALVAEPEPVIRRMLDFCGLSFEPACLQFHKTQRSVRSAPSAAQVRQPLHGGTARSALYGDKLDGLRQRLRDAGVMTTPADKS